MIDLADVMPIERIDDWDERIKRQDATFNMAVLDRPFVDISFFDFNPDYPFPTKTHDSLKDRWLDAEYQADLFKALIMSTRFMGDALPVVTPNLGPDFFAACYGGELVFEEITSFIKPFVKDWDELDNLKFNWDNPYMKLTEEFYDILLDKGRNLFYVGWPDLHADADCLVGFRGPQNLAMDLYDNRERIKPALERVVADFFKLYDHYYNRLTAAAQPCTGWPGIVSTKKWHVPSNDFSYMISPADFNELFFDVLVKENQYMEANVHHLDGKGCLNHLDKILKIKELNMIQWVYGDGQGRASDYIPVYKKIQNAGKGIQIQEVFSDELDIIMSELKPEGVWMHVNAANEEEADLILKKIRKWK
jgi:hypothetical protein